VAVDVGGRIGFGVSETLRFGEHRFEAHVLLGHAGEDEVGRAVDDRADPLNALGGERFAQRADDRDAAADRRFIKDVDTFCARAREDLLAFGGEQRLVRGDDVFAAFDRAEDVIARAIDAADCGIELESSKSVSNTSIKLVSAVFSRPITALATSLARAAAYSSSS
jgi:hypothetical protein